MADCEALVKSDLTLYGRFVLMEDEMASEPRVVGPASELKEPDRFCSCCSRPLKRNVAWLELDQRTDRYHDHGDVPVEKSQGWFPFGMACARRKLAEANRHAA